MIIQEKQIKNIHWLCCLYFVSCKAIFTVNNSLLSKGSAHVIECMQRLNLKPAEDLNKRNEELRLILKIFCEAALSEITKQTLITYITNLALHGYPLSDPIITASIEILVYIENINVLKNIQQELMITIQQQWVICVVNLIIQGYDINYIKQIIKDSIEISVYIKNTNLLKNIQQEWVICVVNLIIQGYDINDIKEILNKTINQVELPNCVKEMVVEQVAHNILTQD